jgi:hypothetical protein
MIKLINELYKLEEVGFSQDHHMVADCVWGWYKATYEGTLFVNYQINIHKSIPNELISCEFWAHDSSKFENEIQECESIEEVLDYVNNFKPKSHVTKSYVVEMTIKSDDPEDFESFEDFMRENWQVEDLKIKAR